MDDVIAQGRDFRHFHDNLRPTLERKGWWGHKLVTDPRTGKKVLAQLGSLRRLRTIFDTNISTAYAAGKWDQIQRLKDRMPYLRYVAVNDDRTRAEHRAWHNTVLPVNDPWWTTHYPPNGWGCRCTVAQLDGDDLERYGLTLTQGTPPFSSSGDPQAAKAVRDRVLTLKAAVQKLPRRTGQAFRGTELPPPVLQDYIRAYEATDRRDKIVSDSAFMSASANPNKTYKGPHTIIVEQPDPGQKSRGSHIAEFTQGNEEEILFPPGTPFEVIDMERGPDDTYIFRLEEVIR